MNRAHALNWARIALAMARIDEERHIRLLDGYGMDSAADRCRVRVAGLESADAVIADILSEEIQRES